MDEAMHRMMEAAPDVWAAMVARAWWRAVLGLAVEGVLGAAVLACLMYLGAATRAVWPDEHERGERITAVIVCGVVSAVVLLVLASAIVCDVTTVLYPEATAIYDLVPRGQ